MVKAFTNKDLTAGVWDRVRAMASWQVPGDRRFVWFREL